MLSVRKKVHRSLEVNPPDPKGRRTLLTRRKTGWPTTRAGSRRKRARGQGAAVIPGTITGNRGLFSTYIHHRTNTSTWANIQQWKGQNQELGTWGSECRERRMGKQGQ